jgi:hypothetical protein
MCPDIDADGVSQPLLPRPCISGHLAWPALDQDSELGLMARNGNVMMNLRSVTLTLSLPLNLFHA